MATGVGVLNPDQYRLRSPITRPEKLLCIGMNYVDHCTEQNIPVPKEPILFSKFNSAITHPGSPILLREETQCLDYEVEMAFVVSKEGKNIAVCTDEFYRRLETFRSEIFRGINFQVKEFSDAPYLMYCILFDQAWHELSSEVVSIPPPQCLFSAYAKVCSWAIYYLYNL